MCNVAICVCMYSVGGSRSEDLKLTDVICGTNTASGPFVSSVAYETFKYYWTVGLTSIVDFYANSRSAWLMKSLST